MILCRDHPFPIAINYLFYGNEAIFSLETFFKAENNHRLMSCDLTRKKPNLMYSLPFDPNHFIEEICVLQSGPLLHGP